MTYMCKSN